MMKDVTEIERRMMNKGRRAMKKMMITVGVAAMLQSGLILEKEGHAMMKEEDNLDQKFKKNFMPLLNNEILDGNFLKEQFFLSLKNREEIAFEEFEVDQRYADTSVKELMEKCLRKIHKEGSNCSEYNIDQYKNFIENILMKHDVESMDRRHKLIIKNTLIEIFHDLTY